jgi:hypothetical protein
MLLDSNTVIALVMASVPPPGLPEDGGLSASTAGGRVQAMAASTSTTSPVRLQQDERTVREVGVGHEQRLSPASGPRQRGSWNS